MSSRTVPAFFLVVMTLLSPRQARTQASANALPSDLRHAIEVFDRAQVSADTATLAGLVTEDYVLVNSDATVDRKPKYLADFLLPGLRMEPYVIEQRVEKAWGDAAIVFGLQRLAWTRTLARARTREAPLREVLPEPIPGAGGGPLAAYRPLPAPDRPASGCAPGGLVRPSSANRMIAEGAQRNVWR